MPLKISLGRILGTVTGFALSGPGGAVLGGLTGGLVDAVLPDVGEKVGDVLGEVGTKMLTASVESVQARLAAGEEPLDRDLQLALRDAFCEALYDIGGKRCFPDEWKSERDVPELVVYPRTPEGNHLWRNQNPLAQQVCESLHQMVEAANDGTLFSLTPPPDELEAQVQTYLQANTLGQVQNALFGRTLVPYLSSFLWDLPSFPQHLRRTLVPRLLVHLSNLLKQRTPAWRDFNRLLLEQLQAQVQTVVTSQQEVGHELTQIVERLDAILAQNKNNNAQALTEWANGLADLLAAIGRIEKQIDEKIDILLTSIVEGNREVVERLESLTVLIADVRAGVHRTEFKVTQVEADVTVVRELVEEMVRLLQAGRGWQPIASNANIVVAERVRQVQVPNVARLESFFEYYTPLFAGREQELTTIGTFLQEQSSGYIFVTGLSGYGKTTLLVNLIHRARGRYLYYFFNRQRGTSKRRDFLRTMCQQLLAYYQIEGQLSLEVSELEALYAKLLRMPLVHRNRPLILVIDGLDEVETGTIRDLMPAQLGEGKYVIFSARATGQDWIGSLDLPRHEVMTIELQAFDAAGVQTLLRASGKQAIVLAEDEPFIREALRISQGDLFYLRFLVQDVAAGKITRGNITQQPEGLSTLLEQWWHEVIPQVMEQNASELVGTLAVAVAPLPRADLLALYPKLAWSLDHLLKRGLARFVVKEEAGYTLCHPRFQEYVQKEKLAGVIDTYRAPLLAYCAAWQTNNSTYARRYYASQLAEAERWDEFHTLVATGEDKQAFAEARHAAEGSYARYLEDLQLAWTHADEIGMTNPRVIGHQVRYALIKSSIHSIAANIPPELLMALVEKGVWTLKQGLGYACQIPERKERVQALRALTSYLPKALREVSLPEVSLHEILEAVRRIGDEEYRAKGLAKLVPYLLDKYKALEVAREIGENYWQAQALAELASDLPIALREDIWREALEVARATSDDYWRVQALAQVASRLPRLSRKDVLREALEVAQTIGDSYYRAQALTSLAPDLPIPLREDALREALEVAKAISDNYERAQALAELILHLPDKCEALEVARAIRDNYYRAQALAELAPDLPMPLREDAFREALEVAEAISDNYDRAQALAELILHLPDKCEALEVARAIGDSYYRAQALAFLAIQLPDHLLDETLKMVRAIKDLYHRAQALASLAGQFPDKLLDEALEVARAVQPEKYRAQALAFLAALSPISIRGEVLREALEAVRTIKHEIYDMQTFLRPKSPDERERLEMAWAIEYHKSRTEALAFLAPHLPAQLLREALELMQTIGDIEYRIRALVSLVPHLPDKGKALEVARTIRDDYWRTQAIVSLVRHLPDKREALEVAWTIREDHLWTKALAFLAPHLPDLRKTLEAARPIWFFTSQRAQALASLPLHLPDQHEALEMVRRAIEDDFWREQMLVSLVPHLLDQQWHEALEIVRRIWLFSSRRAQALASLARHLPDKHEALEVVRAIGNDYWREQALVSLVPQLPDKLLGEGLELVRAIGNDEARAEVLVSLASYLPDQLLREALEVVRATGDDTSRAKALACLAPHLPDQLLQEALGVARAIGDSNNRAQALVSLGAHLPDKSEVLEVARAIFFPEPRARALISLLPHLPTALREHVLREALEVTRWIRDDWRKAARLASLTPDLPNKLLGKALEVAQTIKVHKVQAEALASLAPHLPDNLLYEALGIAQELSESEGRTVWLSSHPRAKALASFVPHLPDKRKALKVAQAIGNEKYRAQALASLAPHLPDQLLQEALEVARAIENDKYRVEVLASLAPHLSIALREDVFREALEAVSVILPDENRAQALASLVPQLVALPFAMLYPLWCETLRILAERKRKELLSDLGTLVPVIETLGGGQAVKEVVQAVQDVGRWWP